MHVPGQNHRDPWFADFYKKCLSDLKMIFGTTDGTTIIFPGTGTGGWESALTNTLSPGDKVVTFRYGLFSHLWIDMMQRLGLDVTVIEGRWGDGAYEDKLAEVLKADADKKIKAVCVVHNETTTGVTSDIPEVRPPPRLRWRPPWGLGWARGACVLAPAAAGRLPSIGGGAGKIKGGRTGSHSSTHGQEHSWRGATWAASWLDVVGQPASQHGACPPAHLPACRCARPWTPSTTPPCCWWMASPPSAPWTSRWAAAGPELGPLSLGHIAAACCPWAAEQLQCLLLPRAARLRCLLSIALLLLIPPSASPPRPPGAQFDQWRVDVAVTGSQKALSIPTGLAMVCASDKALAAMKTATSRRVYYDFADMLRTNPSGNVPYTPILPLLYGMEQSLALMREEGGMAAVAARHHRLAEGCRAAVEGWGLQTLCREPRWKSDSLTVIEVPQGVDSQKVVDVAYAK